MSAPTIAPRPSRECAAELLAASGLPYADLTDAHMEHFFYAGPPSRPSGLVGLEVFGEHALLRSLVVATECRSTGLGQTLLERAEAHARDSGAHFVFLLTTTAEEFFRRRGYAAADRAGAPPAIRSTREFADICPASSAFMVKNITQE